MAKPTTVPRFASLDLIDPTTSENNVAEPNANAKDYGWVPAFVEPFRGWMNWLHRWYYLWLQYINDELEPRVTALENAPPPAILTGQVQAVHIKTTDIAVQENFNILWSKYTNIITLYFPYVFVNGNGSSTQLRIYPDSVWSSHILASIGTQKLWQSMAIIGGGKIQNGVIKIPKVNTDPMDIFMTDSSAGFSPFLGDASGRGFHECSITYMSINAVT